MSAKPLGVFVLTGGKVVWRPAIDVNRVVLGGQLVAITALLVARALVRARAGRPELGVRLRKVARRLAEQGARARRAR
ncbi:hypothetical protein [Paractinoplanes durhamensis]|nr:hypothetical protein [Actinoplanes durhamensis]